MGKVFDHTGRQLKHTNGMMYTAECESFSISKIKYDTSHFHWLKVIFTYDKGKNSTVPKHIVGRNFTLYKFGVCIVTAFRELDVNRNGCQSCSWLAKQGKHFFPCLHSFAPENLVSRDRFGRPVQRQPAHSPHPG